MISAWWTLLLIAFGIGFQDPVLSDLQISHLRCEYRVNPLGVETPSPRLSWTLESDRPGARPTAYRIVVSDAQTGETHWDSGKVASARTFHIEYAGPALERERRYRWKVQVWDDHDHPTAWSEEGWWEMGLEPGAPWPARWIASPLEKDGSPSPSPVLRREFRVKAPLREARLYITALGLYEAWLNGRRVGEDLFTPGWTSYSKQLQYQVYDVTPLLREGRNALGAILGDGWYRGYLAFAGRRNLYGQRRALLAMLRLHYADGKVETVATDASWKASTGPIQDADFYMGETYDARLEMPGWAEPGFQDADWTPVETLERDHRLVATVGPPVRRIEEIRPKEILTTPAGETVVDFGQNLVGWVRIKVQGPEGGRVRLHHAEVLDSKGNFYTENLRAAKQEVTYVLRGRGTEEYEPHFTFQGFRYVRVLEFPGRPTPESFTAVVLHSAMTPTGTFECSDPLINQLQHNIVWGQKGNFVDVPTDCPQRDERLGWTGDAQVFVRTAAFNMDVAAFFTKWLRDLAADQTEDGRVPFVVPDVLGGFASAGWADAATIVPWALYVRYGDRRLLEEQYPSMKAWADFIARTAGESHLWNTGFHFGDWLSATYRDWSFPAAVTDKDLIATAFYAHSTDLVRQAAEVLGKTEDAQLYGERFQRIVTAFRREFLTPNGRLSPSTQTAYALALRFGLLEGEWEKEAARRLVADIRQKDDHLSTGFLGTPHLCHVLTEQGYLDVAYTLLHQDTYPSWLYPVKQGATTIWERWDGIRPDGTFQDPGMNSFNHYAYGAIGEWLYEVVAGIRPDPSAPGYQHVRIQPRPGGKLTWAKASLNAMTGRIESGWSLVDGETRIDVRIPPASRATILLPGVAEGKQSLLYRAIQAMPGVSKVEVGKDYLVVHTGSGRFSFRY